MPGETEKEADNVHRRTVPWGAVQFREPRVQGDDRLGVGFVEPDPEQQVTAGPRQDCENRGDTHSRMAVIEHDEGHASQEKHEVVGDGPGNYNARSEQRRPWDEARKVCYLAPPVPLPQDGIRA